MTPDQDTLCFATNNPHKLAEVRALLPGYRILGLQDIGCWEDIPETADTLEGNAQLKAEFVKNRFGMDAFADDTGLEVKALGGLPGVLSARFAGPQKDDGANCQKLIAELAGQHDRRARFRTVICLLIGQQTHFFEGAVEGTIIKQARGEKGFGYDPLFQPEGSLHTFAEMPRKFKNQISHRGKAIGKLAAFLHAR